MTDKEKLTALLMASAGDCLGKGGALNCSKLADYLIEHGVVVLPCKVGERGVNKMPRTRFGKIDRDPLKELVLGRKSTLQLSEVKLAAKMGISVGRYRSMMGGTSDAWKIGEVKALSRALDIPIDELRALVGKC